MIDLVYSGTMMKQTCDIVLEYIVWWHRDDCFVFAGSHLRLCKIIELIVILQSVLSYAALMVLVVFSPRLSLYSTTGRFVLLWIQV